MEIALSFVTQLIEEDIFPLVREEEEEEEEGHAQSGEAWLGPLFQSVSRA